MKKYRYLILVVSILIILAVCYFIGKPLLEFVSEPETFRVWVQSKGLLGILVFMILNILQVILAIIPGGPFEVGAGYAFGVIPGTILCDIAMSIGGVINFLLVRKFGMKFIELFTTREKIESVKFLKANKKSEMLLFLFFLLPGTPKDLMCYVVGLSNITLSKWVIINLVGRLPAILLSAMGGSALGKQKYEIFVIAIVVLLVLYLIGSYLYNKHNKSPEDHTN
jgi:uncharacterized membrane protein YdjX (TVP38/TMEM64 family)